MSSPGTGSGTRCSPGMPATRPNVIRMIFLDERYRELYPDREEEAQLPVASLRLVAGRHPTTAGRPS